MLCDNVHLYDILLQAAKNIGNTLYHEILFENKATTSTTSTPAKDEAKETEL